MAASAMQPLLLVASVFMVSLPTCTCFELTPEILTQFGLMNKISTGHPMLDILLCMLVPVIVQKVMPHVHVWIQQLFKRQVPKETYSRSIVFTKNSRSYWYYDDGDNPPTSILQDAVLTALNNKSGFSNDVKDGFLELKAGPENSSCNEEDGSDGDSSSDEECYSYKPFLKAIVNVVPACGVWMELENGVRFMREEETVDEGNSIKSTKITYHFQSDDKDGSQRIDDLVKSAFDSYKAQHRGNVDRTRYLYMPVPPSSESTDNNAIMPYKRYALSEERTFASLFHPEKKVIMQLIDNFLHKKGKFAIPGYPQKLGFLLHGPPGTGKTSFIKALAQYTKRNIINIPLARIKTNQELMNIMFDQKFGLPGDDSPIALPFTKTIFVMEDVDAASNVVLRRSEQPSALSITSLLMQQAELLKEQPAAQAASSTLPATADTDNAPPSSKTNVNEASTSTNTGTGAGASKLDAAKDGSSSSMAPYGPALPAGMNSKYLWGSEGDALNLAGLLNILDGVVDTPGRIIIMTSNHPEKLDPALIRPGRINRQIYLGRLRFAEGLMMVRHYFGEVSKADEVRLSNIWVDELWSPAELESLCAECDTTEELVQRLIEKLDNQQPLIGT